MTLSARKNRAPFRKCWKPRGLEATIQIAREREIEDRERISHALVMSLVGARLNSSCCWSLIKTRSKARLTNLSKSASVSFWKLNCHFSDLSGGGGGKGCGGVADRASFVYRASNGSLIEILNVRDYR